MYTCELPGLVLQRVCAALSLAQAARVAAQDGRVGQTARPSQTAPQVPGPAGDDETSKDGVQTLTQVFRDILQQQNMKYCYMI